MAVAVVSVVGGVLPELLDRRGEEVRDSGDECGVVPDRHCAFVYPTRRTCQSHQIAPALRERTLKYVLCYGIMSFAYRKP